MSIIANTTPNIGLYVKPVSDVDEDVQDWCNKVADDSPDSNMMKLDSEIGEIKKGKANLVDSKVPVAELPGNLIFFTDEEIGDVVSPSCVSASQMAALLTRLVSLNVMAQADADEISKLS